MSFSRGEVWIPGLDPTQGSEQAETRPVIIFQDDTLSRFTSTVITIPLTSNLRRVSLPTCLLISSEEGGLNRDSVALCHQVRTLDKRRLVKKIGQIGATTLVALEQKMLITMGCKPSTS